jgi:flavin reductase (DIM6/NTAB) family NADH-FMN oxidoreductase RutF
VARVPVTPLRRAYRLINHGPTTLIGAAHGERRNVMAAQWVMALDIDPPRVAAVLAEDTFTRELVAASGEFTVNLPTGAMVDLTYAVGSNSGRDMDKFERFSIATAPASLVQAPLIEGCAAWLECRVRLHPDLQQQYDLFLADVVAAWADDEVFVNGEWRFPSDDRRTIHHLTRGAFFLTGPRADARKP